MGTVLITRSTPRITYRMGMRAWLEALEDKYIPVIEPRAPDEVAAARTVSLKFYRGMGWGTRERLGRRHYQSTPGKWRRSGPWTSELGIWRSECDRDTLGRFNKCRH